MAMLLLRKWMVVMTYYILVLHGLRRGFRSYSDFDLSLRYIIQGILNHHIQRHRATISP
jgi:hypothetical protein